MDFDSAPSALDLFAGTGSIGVEFVSRGCGKVVSVENKNVNKNIIHKKIIDKVSLGCKGIEKIYITYDSVDNEADIRFENNILYADRAKTKVVRALPVSENNIDVLDLNIVDEVYPYAFFNCNSIKTVRKCTVAGADK